MASRLPQFTSALLRTARPVLVNARVGAAVPGVRQLGAFAPTRSLLKKRGAVVEDFEEEDFSEFEESNNTDDIQTETSQLAGQSKADQFQTAKTKLDAILNQSHFDLRSNLPPSTALLKVIVSASESELPLALDLLAKWRSKSLPLPPSTVSTLASAAARTRSPHTFVTALVDRTRYGLDLASPADADSTLLRLSAPRLNRDGTPRLEDKTQDELKADFKAVEQLRHVVRLANGGKADAVAAVCAASLGGLVEGAEEVVAKRVREASSVADTVILARVGEMRTRDRTQFKRRVAAVAKAAEAKGDKQTTAWATKLGGALGA